MATRKDTRITELEGAVLGLLWKHGPCSGYTIRKGFLESSNPHWSGSRGAIYPALERLARRGLVGRRRDDVGRRRGRRFSITNRGLDALRGWIDRPSDPRIVAPPPDPLRTRLPFLAVLPPAKRRRLLLELRQSVKRELQGFTAGGEHHVRLSDNLVNRLLAEGIHATLVARLAWIDRVRRHAAQLNAEDRKGPS